MAVAVAIASVVATVAGAAMQARGAAQQSAASQQAYNYQAAVAENNKTIAEGYARDAEIAGQQQEQTKRLQTAQQIGGVRAAVSASGLDAGSGSSLMLQKDTAMLGEQDALTIRSNAAKAAYGYRVQGLGYAETAALDRSAASNALTAGGLNQWSSIIGGVSSFSDKWAKYQNSGVFAGGSAPGWNSQG